MGCTAWNPIEFAWESFNRSLSRSPRFLRVVPCAGVTFAKEEAEPPFSKADSACLNFLSTE